MRAPAPSASPSDGRIASLDGWRAVAIAIVLLEHARSTRGFPEGIDTAFAALWHGPFGVRLFFVVSGYLITYLLLREREAFGRIDLKLFYARRIVRIAPVYFLYLGVLAGLAALGLHHESRGSWLGSLLFLRNMIGRGDSATVHLWSLAVEEQFYLVWPVLLMAVGVLSRRLLPWALVAGSLSLAVASRAIECGTPYDVCARLTGTKSLAANADALGIGCALGMLRWRGIRPGREWLTPLALGAGVGILVLGLARLAWDAGPLAAAMPTATALLAGTMIYATTFLRAGPVWASLNNAAVRRLGLWSYSIYIWHFAFLYTYSQMAFRDSVLFDWRLWWIPALLVSIASYELFERPILRLRDRFRPVGRSGAPAMVGRARLAGAR